MLSLFAATTALLVGTPAYPRTRVSTAVCLAPTAGDLPTMYRGRWKDADEESSKGLGRTIELLEKAVRAQAADESVDEPETEACILDLSVCGAASFDSSDSMTCVETYDAEGKLRWVCDGA